MKTALLPGNRIGNSTDATTRSSSCSGGSRASAGCSHASTNWMSCSLDSWSLPCLLMRHLLLTRSRHPFADAQQGGPTDQQKSPLPELCPKQGTLQHGAITGRYGAFSNARAKVSKVAPTKSVSGLSFCWHFMRNHVSISGFWNLLSSHFKAAFWLSCDARRS